MSETVGGSGGGERIFTNCNGAVDTATLSILGRKPLSNAYFIAVYYAEIGLEVFFPN